MKNFRGFDISDFIEDEDFIRWVYEKKDSDNYFWETWLNQNPGKHIVVAEARKVLESIKIEQISAISEQEKDYEVDRLMDTIKLASVVDDSKTPVISISGNRNKKWWYVAATFFMGVAITSFYLFAKQSRGLEKFSYSTSTVSRHLIENINTSEKSISLKLPDESVVELAANSRIAYANNFDSSDTRDVYLSGEAFFKVTRNPARPFRVFANEIVTKVLGTSFIVRSFEEDSVIQIKVKTGKVNVYSQSSDKTKKTNTSDQYGGIILTPNQEVVYKRQTQYFEKSLLDNPEIITVNNVIEKEMLYEEANLEKVFAQLSKIYGINIVYDNELLKKCTVTADLRNESFYKKLDLICKAIGAQYEIVDGQVIIQTNGCN
jgi:hypothetical protein